MHLAILFYLLIGTQSTVTIAEVVWYELVYTWEKLRNKNNQVGI